MQPIELSLFRELIAELPILFQSFDVKYENWKNSPQEARIKLIFDKYKTSEGVITLNRHLVQECEEVEEKLLLILLWGYPTKGRGTNIDSLLRKETFNDLSKTLSVWKEKANISNEDVVSICKKTEKLGISTLSKFLYFFNIYVDGLSPVILDQQIISAIETRRWSELSELGHIQYHNALKNYSVYLKVINDLARKYEIEPENLEGFLFIFGRNLFLRDRDHLYLRHLSEDNARR